MRILMACALALSVGLGPAAQAASAATIAASSRQDRSAVSSPAGAVKPSPPVLEGPPSAQQVPPVARPDQAEAQKVDIGSIVSIARIRRQLREVPPSSKPSVLRIEYRVDVYGKAPKVDLFKGVDLANGPVQYGGMTHREFLEQVTPKQLRAPAGDFMSLIVLGLKELIKRPDEKK